MTNREFLNSLPNNKLASIFAYRDSCSMCVRPSLGINPSECRMYGANCEEYIREWLSKDVNATPADKQFMELGYNKINDYEYVKIQYKEVTEEQEEVYIGLEEDGDIIKFVKKRENGIPMAIAEWLTSKEIEAVQEKIKELNYDN